MPVMLSPTATEARRPYTPANEQSLLQQGKNITEEPRVKKTGVF